RRIIKCCLTQRSAVRRSRIRCTALLALRLTKLLNPLLWIVPQVDTAHCSQVTDHIFHRSSANPFDDMIKARTSWLTGAGARRIITKCVFYARGNLLGTGAPERLVSDTLKRGSLPSRQSRPDIQLVISPVPVAGRQNGSQHQCR